MGRTSHAKEKLHQVASDLIWDNTYVSVSLNQICQRANVHKGSFYHFFRTKADLAIAACEMRWQEAQPELDRIFSPQVPPLKRLSLWCDYIQRTQKEKAQKYGHVCGCPDASVGAELTAQDEKVRIKVEELIERTTKFIESAITEAIREGSVSVDDPKTSARQIFSYVLGLLLQARLRNDLNVLLDLESTVMTMVGAKQGVASDYPSNTPQPESQKPMRFKNLLIISVLGALQFSVQPHSSAAQAERNPTKVLTTASRQWSASLRWENDTFGGTDRFYTDGVALGITHTGPSWMDPVANWLPWGQGRRTVGYDLTQAILTPADTSRPVPDANDRPYAGILAVGISLHVERSNSYHGLKFITGVVGPWSLAEETQREVHRLLGNEQPQGWSHQLENEPILNLAYEYRHKFRLAGRREGWSVEVLPAAGGMLGNVFTQGQIGGLARFGYNIPDDFGITLARGMGQMPPPRRAESAIASSDWGFSIFGGGVANLVLRDITLDGNTFEDSPSVDKKLFVPAAGVGMNVGNRRFLASFTYAFWGKEFKGQEDYSKFGAVTFSYFF